MLSNSITFNTNLGESFNDSQFLIEKFVYRHPWFTLENNISDSIVKNRLS
jgi:hypothetical protein